MVRCTAQAQCRKAKHLTEDGFVNQATDEAIRKLHAQEEDVDNVLQHDRAIAANPDVQAAASIVELFISNVDDLATPEFVLGRLRCYFSNAKIYDNPGHGDMARLRLSGLDPDKAVISFRKLEQYRDVSGKVRRRGCAIAEVPADAVADFFCAASQHTTSRSTQQLFRHLAVQGRGINCAPPGRHTRNINIRRNKRRSREGGGSDSTMRTLAVAAVAIVDIDFREGLRSSGRHGPVDYPARRLWGAELTSVRAPGGGPGPAATRSAVLCCAVRLDVL